MSKFIEKLQMADSYQSMLDDLEKSVPFFAQDSQIHCICPMQMFWIFCHIVKFKPKLFFESGTYKCRSTTILAETLKRYSPDSKLIAVGITKVPEMDVLNDMYDNVEVLACNGLEMAERLRGREETLGVLIDGPKVDYIASEKFSMYDNLFTCKNIKFLFQHDVIYASRRYNLFIKYHENKLKDKGIGCYIIDEDFQKKYKFLDRGTGKNPHPRNMGLYIAEKWV